MLTRQKSKPMAGRIEDKVDEDVSSEVEESMSQHEGTSREDHSYVKTPVLSDLKKPAGGATVTGREDIQDSHMSMNSIPVTVQEVATTSNEMQLSTPTSRSIEPTTSDGARQRYEAGDARDLHVPRTLTGIFSQANTKMSYIPGVQDPTMTAHHADGDRRRRVDLDHVDIPIADFPLHQIVEPPTAVQSLTHLTEPKPRLPTYNGKEDWDAFWIQFEFLADQFGWDENKKLSYLMAGLQDIALVFVSKLPVVDRCSLRGLTSALKQRFGDNVLPETHRASLDLIRKESKETLQEYAARVRELMSRAYPGLEGSELFTGMLIERIVKGLPDSSLVYDVLCKKPRTVEATLDLIEWHECIKAYKRKPANVRLLAEENASKTDQNWKKSGKVSDYVTEDKLMEMCRELKETISQTLQTGTNHVPQVAEDYNSRGGNDVAPSVTATRHNHDHREMIVQDKYHVPRERNEGRYTHDPRRIVQDKYHVPRERNEGRYNHDPRRIVQDKYHVPRERNEGRYTPDRRETIERSTRNSAGQLNFTVRGLIRGRMLISEFCTA